MKLILTKYLQKPRMEISTFRAWVNPNPVLFSWHQSVTLSQAFQWNTAQLSLATMHVTVSQHYSKTLPRYLACWPIRAALCSQPSNEHADRQWCHVTGTCLNTAVVSYGHPTHAMIKMVNNMTWWPGLTAITRNNKFVNKLFVKSMQLIWRLSIDFSYKYPIFKWIAVSWHE